MIPKIPGPHRAARPLRAGQADRGTGARAGHQRLDQAGLEREPGRPLPGGGRGDHAEPAPKISLYPDGDCFYLKAALAAHLGVTRDHLIVGNGSNELIELVLRAFLAAG